MNAFAPFYLECALKPYNSAMQLTQSVTLRKKLSCLESSTPTNASDSDNFARSSVNGHLLRCSSPVMTQVYIDRRPTSATIFGSQPSYNVSGNPQILKSFC